MAKIRKRKSSSRVSSSQENVSDTLPLDEVEDVSVSKYFKSSKKNKRASTASTLTDSSSSVLHDDMLTLESSTKNKSCLTAAGDGTTSGIVKSTTASSSSDQDQTGSRLPLSFFDKPCADLAKALLGKRLVRKLETGEMLSGIIVETEAYLGGEDKAAHSYGGKKTERNAAMFMAPGTAYVYHIYGMYTCMNISSRGEGAAVLLRGIEPISGHSTMRRARSLKRSSSSKNLKDQDLANGPSKLTQALHISKPEVNKKDLTTHPYLWLEDDRKIQDEDIVTCSRIGVDYAGEWAKKPLRFYVRDNKHVSVRDKKAEENPEVPHLSGNASSTNSDSGLNIAKNSSRQQKKGKTNKMSKKKCVGLSETSSMSDGNSLRTQMSHKWGGSVVKSDSVPCTRKETLILESEDGASLPGSSSTCAKPQSGTYSNQQKVFTSKSEEESTASNLHMICHDPVLDEKSDEDIPVNSCISSDFYNQDGLQLAQALLGQTLVRVLSDGTRLAGRIVETEAYLGVEDGSCHCYGGKKTERNAAMFMAPGTAYVYNVYYMYCCFNISCKGEGAVVLVRSLEPTEGESKMRQLRGHSLKDKGAGLKNHQLCNGPSKLCMALSIEKDWANKTDLATSTDLWIEFGSNISKENIVISKRIGIEKTPPEFASKPWRFYVKDNRSVSVIDKM